MSEELQTGKEYFDAVGRGRLLEPHELIMMAEGPSSLFVIFGEGGMLVTLNPNLSVEYGEHFTPERVETAIDAAGGSQPLARIVWRLIQEVERLRAA